LIEFIGNPRPRRKDGLCNRLSGFLTLLPSDGTASEKLTMFLFLAKAWHGVCVNFLGAEPAAATPQQGPCDEQAQQVWTNVGRHPRLARPRCRRDFGRDRYGDTQAQAGFINQVPADVTNFAVLYEGNGNTLSNNGSSNITGNIGIGAVNGTSGSWAASGPGTITGVVEFDMGTSANFTTSNTTYIPPVDGTNPTYNNANVDTDLTALNTLSTTLGGEAATSLGNVSIANGATYTLCAVVGLPGETCSNTTSGVLDSNGNYVFSLSGLAFVNCATLDIQGANDGNSVVINIPSTVSPQFGGTIDLSGGLTSDQVLFNLFCITCTGLTGGQALNITTNGATVNADFLDPNGMINENHAVVNGRIIGGDTTNASIVSGGVLNAPTTTTTSTKIAEPGTLALLGGALAGLGLLRRRRKSV
jgi:hypothetical protein